MGSHQHLHATGAAGRALHVASDKQLGELIAAGHDQAYTELVARHQPPLLQYAQKVTGDTHVAESIVSRALVECLKAYRTGAAIHDPGGWIADKVHLGALEHLDRVSVSAGQAGGPPAPDRDLTSLAQAVAAPAEPAAVRAAAVAEQLSQLTPEQAVKELGIQPPHTGNPAGRLIPTALMARMLDRQAAAAPSDTPLPALSGGVRERLRQQPRTAAAVAGGVVALIAVGYLAFGSGDGTQPKSAAHPPTTTTTTPTVPTPTTPTTPTTTVPAPTPTPTPEPRPRQRRPRIKQPTPDTGTGGRARRPASGAAVQSAVGTVLAVSEDTGSLTVRSGGREMRFRSAPARLSAAHGCQTVRVLYRRPTGGQAALIATDISCLEKQAASQRLAQPGPKPARPQGTQDLKPGADRGRSGGPAGSRPRPVRGPSDTPQQNPVIEAQGRVTDWRNLDITLKTDTGTMNFRLDETMLDTIDGCQIAQVTWRQTDADRPKLTSLKCVRKDPAYTVSDP